MIKVLNCRICGKEVYSGLGEGCKMCGMLLEKKEDNFCSSICRNNYKKINKSGGQNEN